MLDFRSGGWVLLLAGALMLGIVGWRLAAIWPTVRHPAVGDGHNVYTYRFDLFNLTVPADQLVAGGLPRDGLPALVDPPVIRADEIVPGVRLAGVRALHDGEPVIGVVVNGEARCYPHWVMVWHEVANDTLGGRPILVTYSGLCDSSVVFDRAVGGRVRAFGVSGLLYNSNLLMYDRDPPEGESESLWSQLLFRAVAGPAAERGETLEILPAIVTSWLEWRLRHPGTTVLLPDPQRRRLYRRDAYMAYYGSPRLQYPVDPLPEGDRIPFKTPIVAKRTPEGWRVRLASHRGLRPAADDGPEVFALWFAWYAMHPESIVEDHP